MTTALHEDAFHEYFHPITHPDAEHDIWGGYGLETYGRDFELVLRHDPAYVWTVVDGESGADQWIITGVHYVNRVCYLITEIPHNWVDIEFRVRSRPTSLTAAGLKRQITHIKTLLAAA